MAETERRTPSSPGNIEDLKTQAQAAENAAQQAAQAAQQARLAEQEAARLEVAARQAESLTERQEQDALAKMKAANAAALKADEQLHKLEDAKRPNAEKVNAAKAAAESAHVKADQAAQDLARAQANDLKADQDLQAAINKHAQAVKAEADAEKLAHDKAEAAKAAEDKYEQDHKQHEHENEHVHDHIVCYAKGTLITTQSGEVAIEELREGDMILTVSGEYAPLQWLGYRSVDCANHSKPQEAYPVRIVQGAFGDNLPKRDLLLSPWHSVYVNGIFVPAYDLLNDATVYQDQSISKVTYYHLELPSHNAIYAESMPAETYLDDNNRGFFLSNTEDGKHATSLVTEVPKLASKEIWSNKGFAKVVRKGPELEAVREQLAKRIPAVIKIDEKVAA